MEKQVCNKKKNKKKNYSKPIKYKKWIVKTDFFLSLFLLLLGTFLNIIVYQSCVVLYGKQVCKKKNCSKPLKCKNGL